MSSTYVEDELVTLTERIASMERAYGRDRQSGLILPFANQHDTNRELKQQIESLTFVVEQLKGRHEELVELMAEAGLG